AALSPEHQAQVLDFVEFLLGKYPAPAPKKSAEERALERIPDIDDPSQWITVVEIDDPIDENALEAWLDKNGYKALSSPTA
ncbi:MAG: hypothetical protein VKN60_01085, partial [Cyanobacteriota bacterium]|nr:hypothetical protein [Cyanobacteriota bacterium]